MSEQPEKGLRRVLATWKLAYRRMRRRDDSDADKLARDIERLEQRLASTGRGGAGGSRTVDDQRAKAGGKET